MGNEMGNNNVTGLQASDESAKGFDKTDDRMDCSPGLKNINDKEKDASEDLGMSDSLKGPIIPSGGDEKMSSDCKNSPTKNGDLDVGNMDSLQDHTSTQDDDQNSNLPTEQGDENNKEDEIETTKNSTETIITVTATTEDMTCNKDISTSDEESKKLVHETTEKCEEGTVAHTSTFLEENIQETTEDEESCSHEVEVVDGELVGEDAIENLEQGHTEVPTVEHLSVQSPIQEETASSTESIITDNLGVEIKEVAAEDKPGERDNSSYVQPEDDTNQKMIPIKTIHHMCNQKISLEKETIHHMSKNVNGQIPEEKNDICETSTSTSVETVIESDEVLEGGNKIHELENQDQGITRCRESGVLDINEVVSSFQSSLADPTATNDTEFQKHDENSIAAAGHISESLSTTVKHDVLERTDRGQEGIVEKAVIVKNQAENCGEKKSDDINGNDFTVLERPLSDHVPVLNEDKVQEEVILEELILPMTATSSTLQSVEFFVKQGDIKPDSSDSNEGVITSTYEAKTADTQETMDISQHDQSQQILLEEPEGVKFEKIETLSTCMQFLKHSSETGLISPNGSNKEKEGACGKSTCFTLELNQQKITVNVGFTTESKQKKITTNADKASDERCLLQAPALGRDAGEETPLLQSAESINISSSSMEQHSKAVQDIPMAETALMQAKGEAAEESEKSPLLSPREPSKGGFRAPNHSARNKKPLLSLMTEDRVGVWSPLKEEGHVPDNRAMVSSPRSKEKQKRSSLFTSCMCCTTGTT